MYFPESSSDILSSLLNIHLDYVMRKTTCYGNRKDFKKHELLIPVFPIYEKKCEVNCLCTNPLSPRTVLQHRCIISVSVSDYLSQAVQKQNIIK